MLHPVHFKGRDHFAPRESYRLLPFRFDVLNGSRYIVMNDVGEYVVMSRGELTVFTERKLSTDSDLYRTLKARHFLFDEISDGALDLLALKYRTRARRFAEFTGLHIFVVTLRCDHSCHYCQVSRQTPDKSAFDMTRAQADLALDFVFRTPSRQIKIEFQGGEPLLNFELIQYIVAAALERNRAQHRDLQFVIASNLSQLSDAVLAFCRDHDIYLSTSLDGPEALHNRRRTFVHGNSHALAVEGIRRARKALGPEFISALMTTTPESLSHVEGVIDEYVRQGFHSIFLRSLSPYGFATRTSLVRKYDVEDWLAFYMRGLTHILDLNRRGYFFREEYTSIILQKLWSPQGSNYLDLQTPAGIGIGAIVFNYDGAVYGSDEGRMLAEMGNTSFRLGHLESDSYESMMTSDALLGPLADSVLDSAPMCSDCAFLPLCGADPVFHQATLGDSLGHKAFSSFCRKQMGVLRHLITTVEDDREARDIMQRWI